MKAIFYGTVQRTRTNFTKPKITDLELLERLRTLNFIELGMMKSKLAVGREKAAKQKIGITTFSTNKF